MSIHLCKMSIKRLQLYKLHIKEIKKDAKLTTEGLAELLEMSASTLGSYERGDRTPSLDFAKNLNQKLSVNTNWFTTGKGDKYLTKEPDGNHNNFVKIPIRGFVSASMGCGASVYDESTTGYYSISKKLVKDIGVSPKSLEMIFAQGDSMLPTISSGDSLIIDTSRKEIYDGKVYCVRIEGQLYAKRLQIIPPKCINVLSDNTQYESFKIDFSKEVGFDFQVIGEVRWSGRVFN